MKLAIIFHEGYLVPGKTLERVLRKTDREYHPQEVWLSDREPWNSTVVKFAKGVKWNVHWVQELKAVRSRQQRLKEVLFPLTDRQRLIHHCDAVLVLDDGTMGSVLLIGAVETAGKQVLKGHARRQ